MRIWFCPEDSGSVLYEDNPYFLGWDWGFSL